MTDFLTKKILMIIALKNFRDEEFFQPKEEFLKAGFEVVTAAEKTGEAVGMLGGRVKAEINLSQVKLHDYEALVFIGGSGSTLYFNDPLALALAKEALNLGKVVGAICIAASILANAGVLKGKKATSFPSEQENLKAKGAIYVDVPVCQNGLIVTAQGPKAAQAFGQTLVKMLK